jgi:hypothetical protein
MGLDEKISSEAVNRRRSAIGYRNRITASSRKRPESVLHGLFLFSRMDSYPTKNMRKFSLSIDNSIKLWYSKYERILILSERAAL